MFRCFFQPRSPSFKAPSWLPSLTSISSGSRGLLRLSDVSAMDPSTLHGPGLRTGSYWVALLNKHNIGGGAGMQRAPVPTAYQLQVRIGPQHQRKDMDWVYFDAAHGHAFTEAVVRRCLRHDRERPLWLLLKIFGDFKPIVKGLFRKRIIAAWRQALWNSGYDAHGTGLAAGKEGQELFGTVEIKTVNPLVVHDTAFVDLRQHLEKVVRGMEVKLRRPVGGRDAGSRVKSVPRTQTRRATPPYMPKPTPWSGDRRHAKQWF